MKMKLARHMSFHHDLHLLIFRPRGILTVKRIEKDIALLEEAEDLADGPFNRFTDLTRANVTHLEFHQVLRISLHRRHRYGNGPEIKSAFYVTTEEAARIVQVHALVADYSPLRVQMFEKLPAAAKWLGVSVQDLQMGE